MSIGFLSFVERTMVVVGIREPKSYFFTMAEDEIATLKEALRNQLQLMTKLYTELEEEREASASGADEALSMILRLQKEKSEEKMEACQYRQMAEAKLHHAEESLAMLEQVIFQKDIEISSLKHQVQSYKQILLSTKLYEHQRFSSIAFLERTSSCIQVKRQNSMPSLRFSKLCSEITLNDGDGSLLPAIEPIWRGIGDYQNQVKEFGMRKSDSDVKKEHDSATCSWHSAVGSSCIEAESTGNTIQCVSTQHMFEIPKNNNRFLLRKSLKKVTPEPILEAKLMNYQPNFSSQTEVEQLKCQIQQLENDVRIMKQNDLMKGNEELKLLRKIHEQLKTDPSHHIRSSKHDKFSSQDETMFVSLTEAMLSFSI